MSKPTSTAGGGNDLGNAGGDPADVTKLADTTATPTATTEDKLVSRDSYLRVMDQLKETQRKFKEVQDALNVRKSEEDLEVESKLMKSGEVQKLITIKDEKISALSLKNQELEKGYEGLKSTLQSAAKTQAVLSRLPGQLMRQEYMAFIDTDKVIFNPETNEIEEDSVEAVVNDFLKNHAMLLKTDGRTLPNGTPRPTQRITRAEWESLPTAKEKRERLKDVEGFVPSIRK